VPLTFEFYGRQYKSVKEETVLLEPGDILHKRRLLKVKIISILNMLI
jgi:hypothetical protein